MSDWEAWNDLGEAPAVLGSEQACKDYAREHAGDAAYLVSPTGFEYAWNSVIEDWDLLSSPMQPKDWPRTNWHPPGAEDQR
jgi:hypothetical protein